MSKERSRSEARHRRRELTKERQTVDYLRRQIVDTKELEKRRKLINDYIRLHLLELFYEELAFFEIDWIGYKLGEIDGAERQSRFDRRLNRLRKEHPEIYEAFMTPNGRGITPLAELRNEYYPPPKRRF